jgi:hypothetical protein
LFTIIRRRRKSSSRRSENAVIGVYDEADNVIETHEHKGEFKKRVSVIA